MNTPATQMDLETEDRIAAIIMREAAAFRRQSEKEGVLPYLHRPNVRGQPNSKFTFSYRYCARGTIRIKRGRDAVGPRIDETGSYLPHCPDVEPDACSGVRQHCVVYGPERPSSLKSYESLEEEELHEKGQKKAKKISL